MKQHNNVVEVVMSCAVLGHVTGLTSNKHCQLAQVSLENAIIITLRFLTYRTTHKPPTHAKVSSTSLDSLISFSTGSAPRLYYSTK